MSARADELQRMLAPVVSALGYELWGVEINVYARHSLLRIYIDGPAGITVDDCAVVSRQVSSTLDVGDPIQGAYTLEVSSPGWDRPLFAVEHYRRYLGEQVALRLAYPVEGKRNITGRLLAVNEMQVEVESKAGEHLTLPMVAIKRARLVIEAEMPAAKRKKSPRA